jgi:hypothetical protein
MRVSIAAFTIGLCLGFCTANYHFDAQSIYELGMQDGYEKYRSSSLYVANVSYQRGWEDCVKSHTVKKVKLARR